MSRSCQENLFGILCSWRKAKPPSQHLISLLSCCFLRSHSPETPVSRGGLWLEVYAYIGCRGVLYSDYIYSTFFVMFYKTLEVYVVQVWRVKPRPVLLIRFCNLLEVILWFAAITMSPVLLSLAIQTGQGTTQAPLKRPPFKHPGTGCMFLL